MAGDWLQRLRSLRARFVGKPRVEPIAETRPTVIPQAGPPKLATKRSVVSASAAGLPAGGRGAETVAINLGIDFGTSFTKVCFRDVGSEESSVIPFEKSALAGALIPTVVAIGAKGHLYLGDLTPSGATVTRVPYLKMRLAELRLGEDLEAVDGLDLNGNEASRALSSWFLASVLKRGQNWIGRNERNRLKNRTPVWSANVGVPVEHCDSDAIEIFQEVAGVAWLWLKSGSIPPTLSEALTAYERSVPLLPDQNSDFHAVPEIAAAVHSFVISRESVPGIYVYFDIGGGTVDGVAFNLVNVSGSRRINFYSGRVAPLGISAFARALGGTVHDDAAPDLLERALQGADAYAVESFAQSIRLLVGDVVMTAKRKDGRDWERDAFCGSTFERKFIGALDPSRMLPLAVFLGGGGSRSEWYRIAIGSTYEKFGHANAGIPPYKLIEVPKPADLSMRGLHDTDFRRFAIAYGLSIPFGEGPEVGLPSQFAEPEAPRLRTLAGVVDYADSKDVYD
jgi:hypothetical protein